MTEKKYSYWGSKIGKYLFALFHVSGHSDLYFLYIYIYIHFLGMAWGDDGEL